MYRRFGSTLPRISYWMSGTRKLCYSAAIFRVRMNSNIMDNMVRSNLNIFYKIQSPNHYNYYNLKRNLIDLKPLTSTGWTRSFAFISVLIPANNEFKLKKYIYNIQITTRTLSVRNSDSSEAGKNMSRQLFFK